MVEPDDTLPNLLGIDYDLWGVARAPRNVDPRTTASPEKFGSILNGLHNFMNSISKKEADSAEVLFMIEGTPMKPTGQRRRVVALLVGTCYSPMVLDVAVCDFGDSAQDATEQLVLPCLVQLKIRPCRVSDQFMCVDCQTSAEFAALLAEDFGEMQLLRLDYEVPLEIDGSLQWSRITHSTRLGALWAEGQRAPWGAAQVGSNKSFEAQRRAMNALLSTDPLDTTVAPASGRGVKRKAANTSGGRQAAPRTDASAGRRTGGAGVRVDDPPALASSSSSGMDGPRNPPHDVALPEPIMDLADAELAELDDDDQAELEATYGHAQPGAGAVAGPRDVLSERVEDPFFGPPDEETIRAVAKGTNQVAETLGLQGEGAEDGAGEVGIGEVAGASSSSSGGDGGTSHSSPPEPWTLMEGPSTSGYVYFEGRSVMRIQRGAPVGRLTLSCYRHPKCNLLINLNRAPADEVLKQWFFEVDAPPPNATASERKELGQRHLKLARSRWTAHQG